LKPFDFSTSPLVVQYEVKYQTNQECGGAYVKLLSSDGQQLDLVRLDLISNFFFDVGFDFRNK
jgi:hypothetical protein